MASTQGAVTLYDASVPVFKRGLTVLRNILTKAVNHYGAKTSEEIINATLIQDLIPLPKHIQIASNVAKASMYRITNTASTESWPDDEDTVEKLIERCDKTIAFLDRFAPEEINSSGGVGSRVEMDFKSRGEKFQGSPQEYLMSYGIPFFFFHLQIVYSILRMKGVPLGGFDFLGPYVGPHLTPLDTAN